MRGFDFGLWKKVSRNFIGAARDGSICEKSYPKFFKITGNLSLFTNHKMQNCFTFERANDLRSA